MDAGERGQRDPRLVDAAPGDLVALVRARDVLEDEREPALPLVVLGEQAVGHRAADAPREVAVEGDLAQVGAHPDAVARLVGSSEASLTTTAPPRRRRAAKRTRWHWLIWPVPIRSTPMRLSEGRSSASASHSAVNSAGVRMSGAAGTAAA